MGLSGLVYFLPHCFIGCREFEFNGAFMQVIVDEMGMYSLPTIRDLTLIRALVLLCYRTGGPLSQQ